MIKLTINITVTEII